MALPAVGWAGMAFISYLGMSIMEFVKRGAVAIGFGITTYFGAYFLLNQLEDVIQNSLNGLPADVLALLGIMQIDVAATMIISATLAKFTLQGWNKLTDSRKGSVWRKPASSDPTQLGA